MVSKPEVILPASDSCQTATCSSARVLLSLRSNQAAATPERRAMTASVRKAALQPKFTEMRAMLSPARTPPRYPAPSIRPEAVPLPCFPPKSRDMAPARNEYGPRVRKATAATSITGHVCDDCTSREPRTVNTSAVKRKQPSINAARPPRPRPSLNHPQSITEIPPRNGNNALAPAAVAADMPIACVKYVGVHKLKVSRRIVAPRERAQASQNTLLPKNGRSNWRKLLTLSCCADSRKRLAGFAEGSGWPISAGDSRNNDAQMTSREAKTRAVVRNTPRQPSPLEISTPMN